MTHNDMVNCVNEHLHKWYVGNNHFENALNLVNDYDEQIRADERRKFAEWIEQHFSNESCLYVDCDGHYLFDTEKTLAKYEKEQK